MQQESGNEQFDAANGNRVLLTVSGRRTKQPKAEAEDEGEVMSVQEKRILASIQAPAPPLPYPLQELKMHSGPPAQEYLIPEEDREKVLRSIYPFRPCPDLNAVRFDLHEEKFFCVRDFKVIRENERNFLVSPYYAHSGGMVIDWLDEPQQAQKTLFCP